MTTQPSITETRLSLNAHAAAKGEDLRAKYGPILDWDKLHQLLQDRACVRYPTEILFDAAPLMPGEIGYAFQKKKNPEEGFTIFVHPCFSSNFQDAFYVILYQIVVVNYGPFANSDDAEAFGSSALGITQEAYYQRLCNLAQEVSNLEVTEGF